LVHLCQSGQTLKGPAGCNMFPMYFSLKMIKQVQEKLLLF